MGERFEVCFWDGRCFTVTLGVGSLELLEKHADLDGVILCDRPGQVDLRNASEGVYACLYDWVPSARAYELLTKPLPAIYRHVKMHFLLMEEPQVYSRRVCQFLEPGELYKQNRDVKPAIDSFFTVYRGSIDSKLTWSVKSGGELIYKEYYRLDDYHQLIKPAMIDSTRAKYRST
ncbi:hypothetical protein [Desulfurococcus mucosus]|uniref:Uncharacterized protein n=1 Tax=Desulfurococcus mucosus (strain ATCC 35584 / DSM 2162 / JCM 9187 / O7/1) TaxID=765177 RepID=E8RAR6_DESM0|nr:hypothetical protein [Desulfurococcus mucosus]ADV65502.1 hypothetical protein Desmu_1205 [Desulfurococcus mucosus DSM 2162]